ncbi:MAG: TlyA family RNA methyltransferase [Paracoccaceae bacterium]|nr:TlyA family RNA methyltransferase [Paracoccaceae bacterium]
MRLDQRLVELGLAPSRARARALIEAGAVTVDGAVARKPSQTVAGSAKLVVTEGPNPWVSRGALKLNHALDHFGLTPSGIALDLGASTGGFTQVLLARGAERVYAVDVGHGQLVAALAEDPRVESLEGVNARALPDARIPPVDWITADLAFISLTKALPAALDLAKPEAVLVALIKPQFEAGRAAIGRGGIVRDAQVHARVTVEIADWLTARGWQVTGVIPSPIEGGDGNREFLIAARKPD